MERAGAVARRRTGATIVGSIGDSDFVVVSRGRLAAFLIQAGAGARRSFDDLLKFFLPLRQADFLAGCMKKDAVTLWVDVTENDAEIFVYRVLKAYSPHPVGIHDLCSTALMSGAVF